MAYSRKASRGWKRRCRTSGSTSVSVAKVSQLEDVVVVKGHCPERKWLGPGGQGDWLDDE